MYLNVTGYVDPGDAQAVWAISRDAIFAGPEYQGLSAVRLTFNDIHYVVIFGETEPTGVTLAAITTAIRTYGGVEDTLPEEIIEVLRARRQQVSRTMPGNTEIRHIGGTEVRIPKHRRRE